MVGRKFGYFGKVRKGKSDKNPRHIPKNGVSRFSAAGRALAPRKNRSERLKIGVFEENPKNGLKNREKSPLRAFESEAAAPMGENVPKFQGQKPKLTF